MNIPDKHLSFDREACLLKTSLQGLERMSQIRVGSEQKQLHGSDGTTVHTVTTVPVT